MQLKVSSPARGTWIEIQIVISTPAPSYVVPRKGDVDRNFWRNCPNSPVLPSSPARGTWIEIQNAIVYGGIAPVSSPARGTWIEIKVMFSRDICAGVVPRKGDVDRNLPLRHPKQYASMSSPARGTWIEII